MIKELFGWLIAVCRRWAVGCSYDSKTDRARYGLSIICTFYVLGVIVNPAVYFETMMPSWLTEEVAGVVIIFLFIAPLYMLKRVYPNDVAELYINKYKARDQLHSAKQHLLAFLFCFGGWFTLAGPFFIWQLFYAD
jgi:succinate dehydrogenase hydrophobic anchor subunit